ncbi:hypothetical protein ANCCAN_26775 [Ancylostoma caninum]|nr:hypothetical protein ANCCAN_26775 [Ancylostoma caninum]
MERPARVAMSAMQQQKRKSDEGGEDQKNEFEEQFVAPEPPKPRIVITKEDKRNKTLWRHIIWLIVLFVYSLLGGLIFSAIEGGYDRTHLVEEYNKDLELFRRRRTYQEQLFRR